jgi:hypothetical protein
MLVKLGSMLFIAYAVSFSQTVDISGTVQDAASSKPVKGANVRLVGRNLASITDSSGYFHISGTSVKNSPVARGTPLLHSLGNDFIFENETEGPAEVRMYAISGRLDAVIFSGTLPSGLWRISEPSLPAGVYICAVVTPRGSYSIRFAASMTSPSRGALGIKKAEDNGREMSRSDPVKKSLMAGAVDSLLITKEGYSQAKVALDALVKTGLKVSLIADTSGKSVVTIVPDSSWTCFMPDGIPPPELGTTAFRVILQYSAIHDVGVTKFGHRRQFDVKGGTIKGDKIDGSFLAGGLDYELTLSTGSVELEQIDIFKVGNTPVLMRNAGVAPAGAKSVRVVLDFEAPNSSSLTWLNTGKFAAQRIVDSAAKTITLEVYDISKVSMTANRVQIKDPAGVPNQTWDCLKMSGGQGATVFTENCQLGSTITIGASKRGSRNIMLITGGTTSGKVKGKILSGGADFQLGGIDARYTLAPDDGEFILIRNCGSGQLIPVFEARADGPYAFLNENKYVSSSPQPGSGGVSITFYERK